MTFVPRKPWLRYADLLEMPHGERLRYVRGNLTRRGDRRARGLTQDEFAEAIGAKGRQAVIPWEREGNPREPRDYADQIAALTPYPPEAFLHRAGAGVSLATIDLRLRSLEDDVAETISLVREALELLRAIQTPTAGAARARRRAGQTRPR